MEPRKKIVYHHSQTMLELKHGNPGVTQWTTHSGSVEKEVGGLGPEHGRQNTNGSKSHLAKGF